MIPSPPSESPAAAVGRDLRVPLFLAGLLVLATCAALGIAALAAEARRPWAGLLYARAGPLQLSERIRLGLAVNPGPGQVLMVSSNGPADRSGILRGDVVLAVNGVPLADSAGLAALQSRARPGDAVSYRLRRGDSERAATLTLETPLRGGRALGRYAVYLLVGCAFLTLGVLVFARRPHDPRARLFYLLAVSAAVPFVLFPSLESKAPAGIAPMFQVQLTAMVAAGVAAITGCLFGALLLHFALIFPRPRPVVRSKPYAIWWVYGWALVLGLMEVCGILAMMRLRAQPSWVLGLAFAIGLAAVAWPIVRRPRGTSIRIALLSRPLLAGMALIGLSLVLATFVVVVRRAGLRMPAAILAFMLAGLPILGFMAGAAATTLLTIGSMVRSYRESDFEERQQLRWPLWGVVTNLVIGLLTAIVTVSASFAYGPAAVESLQWLGDVVYLPSTLLIPVGFAIGILKHRLMDLDLVIRKTAVYGTVTSLMAVLFFVLVAGIGGWTAQSLGVQNQWVTVFGTLTVAALFVPVRDRVQTAIDRRFYRTRYVAAESLARLGRATAESRDAHALALTVCEELARTLKPRSVAVFARGRNGALEPLAAPGFSSVRPVPIARDPAASLLGPPRRVSGLPEPLASAARELRAEWAVPVRRQRDLLGVVLLGAPLSEAEYEPADLDYLSAVTGQLAAGLVQLEPVVDARELEEARQIQSGLLPRSLPDLPGIRLAAHWQPARHVAGDYYDAFLVDEHVAALCIADVTGKGMPAALLMSNLQAAVRAFASSERSPVRLCERINRVVAANAGDGRFVTLFLAVLDAKQRRLTYVNAGHNPPLLVGNARRVSLDAGGPLLGVVPDAAFEAGEVSLESGDRLLLYTDGVTEAMNAAGELFGEERLLALMTRHRDADPQRLYERLMESVGAFCGGEFQDDATILVAAIDDGATP